MRTQTREISNSEDVIDSRDVIARIEYLEGLRDDFQADNDLPDYAGEGNNDNEKWIDWEESEEAVELDILQSLADEASGADDWQYGSALVRDSYFREYAEEFIDEVYDMKGIPDIIRYNIDWDGVVSDMQQDYISADFDGVTYWVR